MGSKRKRLNGLNMEKKKEVLDLIDKGVSERTIAVHFGVVKSTVGNINKNRGAILKAWEENCSNERKQKL
jgi:DNA invertase Pin-like site-specific DNA recombinase